MLAKCILASPAAGHRLRWREILKLVKSRITRWIDGDHETLWHEATESAKSLAKRAESSPNNANFTKDHNVRRAKSLAQNGLYSKSTQALTSTGLAKPSETILQEMLSKHPQGPPASAPHDPVPSSATIIEPTVLKAVKSFPKGSAPGPSGLRPSHLLEAVCCPSPDRANQLLQTLTKFVNLLTAGRTPLSITPHLCGATLLACPKKKGGHRPIAVGEVLRRLTSKCLSLQSRQSIQTYLTPLQLGVGVRGGCEAIVHATSQLLSSTPDHQSWILMLDFSNAFNTVDRQAMFAEFRNHFPSLSAWVESCYSGQPLLHLDTDTIFSCRGVQQGDPLGPLGFALALHPIVERIKSEVPSLTLNSWYLDDGTLAGTPEALLSALKIVEEDGPSIGLHLNRNKSLLFIPPSVDASISPLPADIPIARDGFTLLGCPISPPDYCNDILLARVNKLETTLSTLLDMNDAHVETTLLRSCLAIPKLSYILRTCPPDHITHATRHFDSVIRKSLESIVGSPITDWSWLKASLPSNRGGLNLRSAATHAPAAFISSASSS